MSTVIETPAAPAAAAAPRPARRVFRMPPAVAAAVAFTIVNGLAFYLVRPDVNDLWAARARAAAATNGVGLTYWFGWFGGGTTPGSYSVFTPEVCALIGTELVCALSAVAVTVTAVFAVRNTPHPVAATWAAAVGACINLWSGRVPFLFGAAVAIGAVIAIRARRPFWAVILTVASMAASPVSGAFLVLGLSGTFITTRTREWRPIIGWVAGVTIAAMLTVAVVFGPPGNEPFSWWLALITLGCLILLWWAAPADHMRTTLAWSFPALLVVFLIPNSLGSNYVRFVWFVLPVMVLATTARPIKWAAALVVPILATAFGFTVSDLYNAGQPVSSALYYQSLVTELGTLPDMGNYRLEVVSHGAYAGYDALLGHAMLARGWETQEDTELNSVLTVAPLAPVTYKIWLDNNAVGYVALPLAAVDKSPEYDLVASGTSSFLTEVWHDGDWRLFRVQHSTPIVAAPASVVRFSQAALTVHIPCACVTHVRVRYKSFLTAVRAGAPAAGSPVQAEVDNDGSGWTVVTTSVPGTYVMSGSLGGGSH